MIDSTFPRWARTEGMFLNLPSHVDGGKTSDLAKVNLLVSQSQSQIISKDSVNRSG